MLLLYKCEFNHHPVTLKCLPLIQPFLSNFRSHFQLPPGFQNQRCPTGEPTSNRLNWVPFSRNLLLHCRFHLSAKAIGSVQSSQAILSYFSSTTHPPTKNKQTKKPHKVLPPLTISTPFYSDYSSLGLWEQLLHGERDFKASNLKASNSFFISKPAGLS